MKPLPRQELKFLADSLSPLKWTRTKTPQSSLEDFGYETGVLTPGGYSASLEKTAQLAESGKEYLLLLPLALLPAPQYPIYGW